MATKQDAAILIIAAITGRNTADAREIYRLVTLHKEAVDKTEIFLDANCTNEWTFEAFIEGVCVATMAEIESQITEDQWYRLDSIMLRDTNAEDACEVAAHTDASEREAAIFADMCKNGVTQDKLDRLIKAGGD